MALEEQVKEVVEKHIRPALEGHGGGIDLLSVDEADGKVTVRLTGACGGCPFAQETLRGHVEAVLKHEIPEVKSVIRG